jgi:hypothetical protein
VPIPVAWEGARLSANGTVVRLVYITGDAETWADRADVRWDAARLTVTLTRMGDPGDGEKLAAFYRCVELRLSRDAGDLLLVDGATGERVTAKESDYLAADQLQGTERTLDSVFEPMHSLDPVETGAR